METDSLRERSNRARAPRQARHRRPDDGTGFTRAFTALGTLAYGGAQVSACILDPASGQVVQAIDDRVVLPTASLGKILLLIEVSARMTQEEAFGFELLDKRKVSAVTGPGLWQSLAVPVLPVSDLAALVGATDDDLATNALLSRVSLDSVRARAESVGLTRTALLDEARDARGPDEAPHLSVGSTSDFAQLFSALSRGEIVDPTTSERVMGWLAQNADLSLVASAFGLDPLSHQGTDGGVRLVNATGIAAGVRTDAGVVHGPRASVAYAVTVRFADENLAGRLRVLDALRMVGYDLMEFVH